MKSIKDITALKEKHAKESNQS